MERVRILVLHGPNLNLTGEREPAVYGTATLAEIDGDLQRQGEALGIEVECFQSNHEGDLIDRIHEARRRCDAIIINPGALTHYSFALQDALRAVGSAGGRGAHEQYLCPGGLAPPVGDRPCRLRPDHRLWQSELHPGPDCCQSIIERESAGSGK